MKPKGWSAASHTAGHSLISPLCGQIVVQSFSRDWLFATPWTAARQASLPSPSPRACSNSCTLSGWYHPNITSSVVLFSSRPQSFQASGSFPVSQLFASVGQGIGASASVLPMNIQGWFPLGLAGLILLSKRLSRVFSSTTVRRHQSFSAQSSLWSSFLTSVHDYWKKIIALTKQIFVSKVMSLVFITLSRFVVAFLPWSRCLLI